ncbi:MAG: dihydrolipoyl dehydrogenase [Actinobacteria bacterium]|nr:dihydrolipoyl dehydrogenase [Actinomycetota bacterium]
MEQVELDAAVIGAGSAGLRAMARILNKTDNALIFEGGKEGTTCARIGCMPSKAFIHVANMMHTTTLFEHVGIEFDGDLKFDSRKAMKHVRDIRDSLVEGTINGYRHFHDKVVHEYAEFIDPMTLRAGDTTYKCKAIVLACGSTPIVPPGWNLVDDKIITTDTVFELEELPKTALVIGMGAIGIELGQAMSRMGVKVTGVEMLDVIAGIQDPVIEREFKAALSNEFEIMTKTTAILDSVNEKVFLKSMESWEGLSRGFDLIVLASGRRLNFDHLNIEESGLTLGEGKVPVYDKNTLKCEGQNVFIAGDASFRRPLLHEATDEGIIAGLNAVSDGKLVSFKPRVPLSIIFTDPNVCSVGQQYNELTPDSFVIGVGSYANQGRAAVSDIDFGLIHIYVDKNSRKILGAEMAAPAGEHLSHSIASYIQNKMTVDEAFRIPYYHPTFEEGISSALNNAMRKLS